MKRFLIGAAALAFSVTAQAQTPAPWSPTPAVPSVISYCWDTTALVYVVCGSGHTGGIVTSNDGGTKTNASTMPAGGVGLTGWLSGILTSLGTPMQNSGGSVAVNPGARTIVPLDIATVTTGGTAVTALSAGHRTAGGWLLNPVGATVNLCINEVTTASGTTSAGSLTCITPGQGYAVAAAAGAVSVISSDSSHPFSGYGWQ